MNSPSTSNQKPARRITSRAREALITDPEALLTALAIAEERARQEEEMRHVPATPIEEADSPEGDDDGDGMGTSASSPVVALPRLRDDERLARREHREVVVIIRRRRAA